ncbi:MULTISPECIES: aspartate kinase [Megasphaera]|uniref:Aspartokinase n=1 Tax=Megasphaera hutchinsoni TaxID=1588748 RepID=A0A134CEW4_9FIRM|nr:MULTISPECIES: aspartate kinase [Megasphaera]MUP47668.1 aspartate kinase [Veillonellaceae bacterium M2-8]MUP59696.1 aspartate kinase [Veillonellaceae bacterium M2-4]EGS32454.1 aspartate kinase, monofunctional class [Megasphaera sp. UPII 135-E]KXB90778.1 aspartate kinase, monofunctional class [Megasphaera hutchinsoni]PNH21614.1 aspartate kinase [Megasphaera genomosp. type_2]
MALIVKKFGGSSVATPDKISSIVQRVIREKKEGDQIVIVVSAMGDTTDELVTLANKITSKPYGREMDMLLATGEQISIALMAMAFEEAGEKAISFTGGQAGIMTSAAFNKGRILDLQPARIFKALQEGNIVIVAGFQGQTSRGDITTLGRGGSDTTAVAIAGAIHADVCEIFTDVDGIYTSDPRVVPAAQKMESITYGEMLEMAKLGAGVMQPRAVEMGSRFNVPIHVRSTFSEEPGTMIQEDYAMKVKQYLIRGVAQDKNVAKITVLGIPNRPGFAYQVFAELAEKNVDVDMIVQSVRIAKEGVTDITFTIARTELPAAREVLAHIQKELSVEDILVDESMAKVSLVGAGMAGHPGIAAGMFGIFSDHHINIEIISTSEISISCLIAEESMEKAVQAIHAHFFKEN